METSKLLNTQKEIFYKLNKNNVVNSEVLLKNEETFHIKLPELPSIEDLKSDKNDVINDEKLRKELNNLRKIKLFISYSNVDKDWLIKIQTIFYPLTRNESILLWSDTMIEIGDNWQQAIKSSIHSSDGAILLVTSEFTGSKYILSEELPLLIEASKTRGLVIFWIAISNCLFEHTPLINYQSVNDPRKPLDRLTKSKQTDALVDIVRNIVNKILISEPSKSYP